MMYTLSNTHISITVSSLGAELVSLKKGNREYLYQKTDGFWQRQSPVLFPIVGALSGGAFEYEGKVYPMSQHGFARDREFVQVPLSRGEDPQGQGGFVLPNTLNFLLNSDTATLEKYPFPFTLMISYILEGDALKVLYIVENTGEKEIYFSIGGHPAFALEGAISEYSLEFSGDREFARGVLRNGLLDSYETINIQNGALTLSEELFARDALVLKKLHSPAVELWKGDEQILTLNRGNMPHFGIWRQPDAPFLCLEPWQGYTSKSTDMIQQLSEKEGIVKLGAGESREWWWSVEIC